MEEMKKRYLLHLMSIFNQYMKISTQIFAWMSAYESFKSNGVGINVSSKIRIVAFIVILSPANGLCNKFTIGA